MCFCEEVGEVFQMLLLVQHLHIFILRSWLKVPFEGVGGCCLRDMWWLRRDLNTIVERLKHIL